MNYLIKILTLLVFISPLASQTLTEPSIKLQFSIDTRFGLVKAEFQRSKIFIKDKVKGKAFIEVDISSLNTNNSMRDNHLKSEDFFHIEKFPKSELELISLEKISEELYKGKGNLTIKSIQKNIEFDAKLERSDEAEVYKGQIKLNRRDYDLNYDSMINPIKDFVVLEFTVIVPIKK